MDGWTDRWMLAVLTRRAGPSRGRLRWPYLQVRLLEQEARGLFRDMVERKWIKSTNEIN